jgi:hypothetical protein
MKRFHIFSFLLIAGLVIIASCKKNEVENAASINNYYTYFPTRVGSIYIYRVDSLTYNYFKNRFDTSLNYLKEVIDSPYIDNTGDRAYKVLRYWSKDTTTAPWVIDKVWTEKRTTKTAERWEENTRYIKLSFPVVAGRSWNGNAYNNGYYSTVGQDSFRILSCSYAEVHVPFKLAGRNYDSTVLVNLLDYSDFLQHLKVSERYAAKVGLIYKEITDTASNGLHRVQGSYFYKQTLLQYK